MPDLAHTLEPALQAACDARLSRIDWFRSAWQASSASTGFASFTRADGSRVPVVVKLPVGPSEYRWTTMLSGAASLQGPAPDDTAACPCTPRVLAAGMELGGYDLAWLVLEKLDGTPLSARVDEPSVRDLLGATVSYYAAAAKSRPICDTDVPPTKDWNELLSRGRDVIKKHGIPDEQRWNLAIKAASKALPTLLSRWNARPINTWCHGDLHFGNALRRSSGEGCVLIDLALVHPGHWVEDAVYLERLYWAKPEMLHGIKPVTELARLQRERQMLTGEDYSQLASIRRVLMAASVPAFLVHEGHPKYVHAALELLERLLPTVS